MAFRRAAVLTLFLGVCLSAQADQSAPTDYSPFANQQDFLALVRHYSDLSKCTQAYLAGHGLDGGGAASATLAAAVVRAGRGGELLLKTKALLPPDDTVSRILDVDMAAEGETTKVQLAFLALAASAMREDWGRGRSLAALATAMYYLSSVTEGQCTASPEFIRFLDKVGS